MSWLTPLGFLGFIGLIILIIIYIIKPNYQQKFISSTFVWKLSLKYRRKKIPINHLRNLLIFLCQVLIISSCALILARPVIKAEKVEKFTEKVAIIDASASMWTSIGKETRFERAVHGVIDLAEDVEKNNGSLTVIVAGPETNVLCQRQPATDFEVVYTALEELIKPGAIACSYGEANIEGAMEIAENVLYENPETEVRLYTGTDYLDKGKVEVVNVADVSEWNAAILDVRAVLDDGYYRFEVDVATYNVNKNIEVEVLVYGVNGDEENYGRDYTYIDSAQCVEGEVTTITIFHTVTDLNVEEDIPDEDSAPIKIYAYDHVMVSIVLPSNDQDNFTLDNYYYLYGGTLPVLKVQYTSYRPNPFIPFALMTLRNSFSANNEWDLDLTEVNVNTENGRKPEEYATSGFDMYIFEHEMPDVLPTDGFVLLINPPPGYTNEHMTIGAPVPYAHNIQYNFLVSESSPLMNYFNFESIFVTSYTKVTMSNDFIPLAVVNESVGDPVILVKDDGQSQIMVFMFSLHYSNLVLFKEYPIVFANMFYHFIPPTMSKHVYEVYDTISLNARGDALTIEGPGVSSIVNEFPHKLKASTPGVYNLSQVTLAGEPVEEYFYVKIPTSESNIVKVVEELTNPYFIELEEKEDNDLILYFAAALVALLFIEWLLQLREHF